MKATWWKSGTWNTVCDRCGFKYKAGELKETWDKLMVCSPCWEIRHPQELIRPIPDQAKLPWTRPEATDQFISVTYTVDHSCPINGEFCQADYAAADCAEADNFNGALLP